MKLVGQRLRQAREQIGLSQEELANMVGKDQTAISEYENGKRKMTITDLPQFSEALAVSITYFFEGDISPDDMDRALLREFHQLPSDSKGYVIEIVRLLGKITDNT